jgi:chromate transporter
LPRQDRPVGSIAEIFLAYLKLGLTCFGGPIAHLGYFRQELVIRRRWLGEQAYADLLAFCQFLPGPTSSQVGFAIGMLRGGGLRGGLAAWLGFTLPSAVLMFAFALAAPHLTGPIALGALHGLKLVAVAVVAQAILGMARSLAPDLPRAAIALAAFIVVLAWPGAGGQLAAIVMGALAGFIIPSPALAGEGGVHAAGDREVRQVAAGEPSLPISRRAGAAALLIFAALFLIPAALAATAHGRLIDLFNAFYRAGALVFGGGHVVLPLLQSAMVAPGWISNQLFLAGYGAAQAIPGPLFTIAAYLGAIATPAPLPGAATSLIAIFLPGLLLVYAALPFWHGLRTRASAQAAIRGTNAAVIALLAAALCTQLWPAAIRTPGDLIAALAGFLLLTTAKCPAWLLVALLATLEAVLF